MQSSVNPCTSASTSRRWNMSSTARSKAFACASVHRSCPFGNAVACVAFAIARLLTRPGWPLRPYIALAAMFTVRARSAALKKNDTTPCAATVRRITLLVTPTSETCEVMPTTSEK